MTVYHHLKYRRHTEFHHYNLFFHFKVKPLKSLPQLPIHKVYKKLRVADRLRFLARTDSVVTDSVWKKQYQQMNGSVVICEEALHSEQHRSVLVRLHTIKQILLCSDQ